MRRVCTKSLHGLLGFALTALLLGGCGIYVIQKECDEVGGRGCFRTITGLWSVRSDPDFRGGTGPREICVVEYYGAICQ